MPHVQTLFDKFKGSKDILVLSFNIDDNPGLAQPIVKQGGFTFPVVTGQAFFETVDPTGGVPQSWIVNPEGVASKVRRFNRGEQWVQEATDAIGKLSQRPR